MQTLWTRVAQVRGSCRCPQCLHTAQGIARKVGTATAHTVRPKYWTSSTLWYSGIFAAAATFDAGLKQQRREQWDKAIAEVKQELGQDTPHDQKRAKLAAIFSEGIGIGVNGDESVGAIDEHADQVLSSAEKLTRDAIPLETRDKELAALFSEGVGIGVNDDESVEAIDEHTGQILSNAEELTRNATPLEAGGTNTGIKDGTERYVPYNEGIGIGVNGDELMETTDEQVGALAPLETRESEGRTIDSTSMDADTEFLKTVERYVDSSTRRKSRAKWPTNTGHDLNIFHLPPQSIYAHDWNKRRVEAKRWSEKKVKGVELQTEILMMRFFEWLAHHKEDRDLVIEEAAGAVPPLFASYIRHYANMPSTMYKALKAKHADAQRLRDTPSVNPGEPFEFQRDSRNAQLCNYAQDDMGQYQDILSDMNTSIRGLFDQADSSVLTAPQYLAKVFYNLSVSSAPPNVDTFNTLITRLHRLDHLFLTRQTVLSFLRASIRPNEVSLAAILNFRTDMDDEEGFRYILEMMTGKRQQFLMEAAPWTRKPGGSWYHGNRILPREDHMVQKPHATPMVFTALLRGVLRFNGFDHALRVMKAWAKEGWGLDVNGFSILLKDCADRDDWIAGLAVWRQIQGMRSRMEISTCTIADMLHLCTRAGEKEEFKSVMAFAFNVHRKAVKSGVLIDLVKERQEARRSKKAETPDSLGQMRPAVIRQSTKYDSSDWRVLRREEEEPCELVSGSQNITAENIPGTDMHLGESRQVDAAAEAASIPLDGLDDSGNPHQPRKQEQVKPRKKSQRSKLPARNREEVVAEKAEHVPMTDLHLDELHQVDEPARAIPTPLDTLGNRDGAPQQLFKAWEESQRSNVPELVREVIPTKKSHDASPNNTHQWSTQMTIPQDRIITKDQLYGHDGGSEDLNEYELRERPMSHTD